MATCKIETNFKPADDLITQVIRAHSARVETALAALGDGRAQALARDGWVLTQGPLHVDLVHGQTVIRQDVHLVPPEAVQGPSIDWDIVKTKGYQLT